MKWDDVGSLSYNWEITSEHNANDNEDDVVDVVVVVVRSRSAAVVNGVWRDYDPIIKYA